MNDLSVSAAFVEKVGESIERQGNSKHLSILSLDPKSVSYELVPPSQLGYYAGTSSGCSGCSITYTYIYIYTYTELNVGYAYRHGEPYVQYMIYAIVCG